MTDRQRDLCVCVCRGQSESHTGVVGPLQHTLGASDGVRQLQTQVYVTRGGADVVSVS